MWQPPLACVTASDVPSPTDEDAATCMEPEWWEWVRRCPWVFPVATVLVVPRADGALPTAAANAPLTAGRAMGRSRTPTQRFEIPLPVKPRNVKPKKPTSRKRKRPLPVKSPIPKDTHAGVQRSVPSAIQVHDAIVSSSDGDNNVPSPDDNESYDDWIDDTLSSFDETVLESFCDISVFDNHWPTP